MRQIPRRVGVVVNKGDRLANVNNKCNALWIVTMEPNPQVVS